MVGFSFADLTQSFPLHFPLPVNPLDLSSLLCLPGLSFPQLWLCSEEGPEQDLSKGDLESFSAQSKKCHFSLPLQAFLCLVFLRLFPLPSVSSDVEREQKAKHWESLQSCPSTTK